MNVTFWYDFGSPNAWFAHHVIPGIEARTGATFTHVPVLLGGIFKATGNQAPMIAFGGIKGKMDYEMLETRRFIAAHGLTAFRFNPHFPVNTLLMMRGALAARRLGCEAAYDEAMFAGMWEQGLKLDLPDVWERALTDAGLPAEQLAELAADGAVKGELVANTERAVARGVFGIPSFFLGDELWFGKDRLRDVVEAAEASPAP